MAEPGRYPEVLAPVLVDFDTEQDLPEIEEAETLLKQAQAWRWLRRAGAQDGLSEAIPIALTQLMGFASLYSILRSAIVASFRLAENVSALPLLIHAA